MTTDTTFHIEPDATESHLEALYLPKRRRDVEPDAPSQTEEALPLPVEPESALAATTVVAPKTSAPDDGRETLYAQYLSVRNNQIKAAASAYELQLRAYYEHRDFLAESYSRRSEEQAELAAECEKNADALQVELEEWSA